MPYLENGHRVDQAILEQDMKIEVEPQPFLPPLKDTQLMIPTPIVIRAITKSRHLINAILKKYRDKYNDNEWTFDRLNIELAREINTQKEKKEITSAQLRDKNSKQKAVDFIVEQCGEEYVTSKNILKVRLWQQQDEYCLYSLSKYKDAKDAKITTDDIVNEIKYKGDAFDIDHILPISRSSDDSISNKVLVFSGENRAKSNKTPYEYFGNNSERWDKFESFIRSKEMYVKLGKAKVGKFTMRDFAIREQGFLERHLNDTRIISKTVKNYVEKYLKFKDDNQDRRVYVVSGKLTSTLRHQWGLENKNRENHYHHFEDAVLIAFSNASIINRLSKYYHALETHKRDGKDKPKFTKPYENFVDDINAMVEKINVVHVPKVENSGKVHGDKPKKKEKFKGKNGLEIRGGLVGDLNMVRIDVLKDLKKEIYSLVPLYLHDLNQTPMPDTFMKKTTKTSPNKERFDSKKQKFVYTLYPYNLIEIKTKKETIRGYFVSANVSDANIKLISMDNKENDVFKKRLDCYYLSVNILSNIPKEEKKEHIEYITKMSTINRKEPIGVYSLLIKLKIDDIKKDGILKILTQLSKEYSIDTINNYVKNYSITNSYKNDSKVKISLDFNSNEI
ncbi:MAG TPA: type II CRISPR RNA-guided endonuclease Cas9, partial [Saprospiraceae bacterium]|nr:type II CRISPR RNA-guided endonuclease Cas9 [Saprospiraceae bacterium]